MTGWDSLTSRSSRRAGEWSEESTRLAWWIEDDEEDEEDDEEEIGETSKNDMMVEGKSA
jgi:hypothetical protein